MVLGTPWWHNLVEYKCMTQYRVCCPGFVEVGFTLLQVEALNCVAWPFPAPFFLGYRSIVEALFAAVDAVSVMFDVPSYTGALAARCLQF
eukprot:1040070-Pelagomonas_calceolata.AAC.6